MDLTLAKAPKPKIQQQPPRGQVDGPHRVPVRIVDGRPPLVQEHPNMPMLPILVRNHIRECVAIFSLLGSLLISSKVNADTFSISGGGTISGKLLSDPKADPLKILTSDGIEIEIARKHLKEKEMRLTGEREQAYIKSVLSKNDSLESHHAVVKECISNHQQELANAHKERIVELDPSDNLTWTALGYKNENGVWLKWEHVNSSKGLVKKYKSQGWTTPHAKAIAETDDNIKQAKADINAAIERHLRNLGQSNNKGQEATNFFRTLDNPLAIGEITKLFKEDLAVGQMRNVDFWLGLLAQMPGTSASGALIELAMSSKNQKIEEECFALLTRTPESTEIAFSAFMSYLGNKDVTLTDQAGTFLQSLNDIRAIPTLIEALTSTIKRTVQSQGGNNFSSGGGVASTMGNTKGVIEKRYDHQQVLQALVAITGENFLFDKEQWRFWYARTYADSNLDLRRNP
jgi:hypothetical protein